MLFQALLTNQHLQCRSNHGGRSKRKQFFLSLHRLRYNCSCSIKNEKKTWINIEKHVNQAVRMSRLWEDYGRVTVNVDLDDDDSWISRLRKKGWNKQKKCQTEISLPELQQHVVIFQPTERISYFRSKTGGV